MVFMSGDHVSFCKENSLLLGKNYCLVGEHDVYNVCAGFMTKVADSL